MIIFIHGASWQKKRRIFPLDENKRFSLMVNRNRENVGIKLKQEESRRKTLICRKCKNPGHFADKCNEADK